MQSNQIEFSHIFTTKICLNGIMFKFETVENIGVCRRENVTKTHKFDQRRNVSRNELSKY